MNDKVKIKKSRAVQFSYQFVFLLNAAVGQIKKSFVPFLVIWREQGRVRFVPHVIIASLSATWCRSITFMYELCYLRQIHMQHSRAP